MHQKHLVILNISRWSVVYWTLKIPHRKKKKEIEQQQNFWLFLLQYFLFYFFFFWCITVVKWLIRKLNIKYLFFHVFFFLLCMRINFSKKHSFFCLLYFQLLLINKHWMYVSLSYKNEAFHTDQHAKSSKISWSASIDSY